MRWFMKSFLALKDSRLYNEFENGEREYYAFALKKKINQ
jgi:hypothetical protein